MEVLVGIKTLPYILSWTAYSTSEFKYPRVCKHNVEMLFTNNLPIPMFSKTCDKKSRNIPHRTWTWKQHTF